jgi:AraC-like DNA-binding protein
VGLQWLLCPVVKNGELVRVYGLGPFLPTACSSFALDTVLANAGATLPLRAGASVLLRELPLLSYLQVQSYAAMMHYVLWEEKLEPSQLRLLSGGTIPPGSRHIAPLDDAHAFEAEQETLRRVQEGDLSLLAETDRVALGDLVLRPGTVEDALPYMKNAVQARLALLSRAAIAGGLSIETGLSLQARYAQNVELADSAGALLTLLVAMQEEFVQRVHAVKALGLSAQIESACTYMDRHLQEPLSIRALAEMTGYAEYYFSRKFKREMGITPAEYMRRKRLERATVLLLTTSLEVGQIAESLCFCSQSYFSDIFRRQYGTTPGQYRRAGMP